MSAPAPQNAASSPAGRPATILVVDDEESIHIALGRVLRRLGFEVQSAMDGATALNVAQNSAPEVVLLDLRMPGMDGHTLLRRFAALPRRPCVVVVSGEGTMDDVIDVLRAGAVDYVKKPWNTPELMAAITRAIELYDERSGTASPSPAPEEPSPRAAPASTPAPAHGERVFRQILDRLRRGEIPLPSAPAVLTSLRSSVLSPGSDLDDIAAKIEQDQRLSADMLRMANAAHFARLGRATSVRAAVQRLGLRHVHNLVETLFLQGFFKGREGRTREALIQLWRRSVARAVTMRALSDLAPAEAQVDGDVAYLCGLMADVGASLLLWVDSERGGTGAALAPATADADGPTVLQRYHEELGATLLERWGFESAVVALARHHHHAAEPTSASSYWRLAVLAGGINRRLLGGADVTEHAPPPATVAVRCASELQLSEAVFARLSAQLQAELSAVVQTIG